MKVVEGRRGRLGQCEESGGGEEGVGWGGGGGRWVRKGESAFLMKERKKEGDVFFRPLPRGAIKNSDLRRRHGHRKREREGGGGQRKEEKKKE